MQKMEYLSLDGIPEEAEADASPVPVPVPVPVRPPVRPAVVTPEVTPCVIAYYVFAVSILLTLLGAVIYGLTGYDPL